MYDCNYLIIPTPKENIICSSCGKNLTELPNYSQIRRLYLVTARDQEGTEFFGLGFGVPMCDDCDEEIMATLRKTRKSHRVGLIILFIVASALIGAAREGGAANAFLVLPILGALIFFLTKSDKIEDASLLEKVEDKGYKLIEPVVEMFEDDGWGPMSDRGTPRDYTLEDLKVDLEDICDDGEFCVLENSTGLIMDYHDEATLSKIYLNSGWILRTED